MYLGVRIGDTKTGAKKVLQVGSSELADLAGEPRFGNACNFTVKDLEPFNQFGHFCAQQFREADMKAK
jgi:hypothetical protein